MDAVKRPDPSIVKNVFSEEDFNFLLSTMLNFDKTKYRDYDPTFGRYCIDHYELPLLNEYAEKTLTLAKEVFNSQTLKPTYTLFSHYEGEQASLFKHKDTNACTYTLDLCLYYKKNWSIFVKGVEYFVEPNEALAFYGNDQYHWREEFPESDTNFMGVVFFHYAEPDHWFFNQPMDRHIEFQKLEAKKLRELEGNESN